MKKGRDLKTRLIDYITFVKWRYDGTSKLFDAESEELLQEVLKIDSIMDDMGKLQ